MSISVTLHNDDLTVVGSPFEQLSSSKSKVHFAIDPDLGTIELDAVSHKHFELAQAVASFKRDVTLTAPPCPFLSTHFSLAVMKSPIGTSRFAHGDWFDVKQGESYFTYNTGVQEVHGFKANLPVAVDYIDVQPDYLMNLLADFSPDRDSPLWNFKEKIERNEFAGAGAPIALPEFYQVLNSMFNCPLQGYLGQLMLEASLQQLMALQFSMLGSCRPTDSINLRDRDVLYAVRDYLKSTFQEEHSLLELSRKFGINQNKLKTGFRELFGTPVIAYLFDLKMRHARSLLQDRDMNVSQVAPIVGYRNANHFTTAFKRKFGITPSRVRG
jgi:AraC-like DNA-binding protein